MIDRRPAPGISEDVPTPAQALALREAESVLAAALAWTPKDEITRMVGRLATIYRDERLSQKEADMRLATYKDLLQDIPPDLLSLAFKRAGQTCRFFPTVAELRDQVRADLALRNWRLGRARYLADLHDRDWCEPAPTISDVEREMVQRSLGALARTLSTAGTLSPTDIEARETRRAEILERVEREARPVDM